MTTIESQSLPRYVIPGIGVSLLAHQVVMESRWDDLQEVMLTAGTGTGKTLAAFLPALRRGESVISAYPTNALLRDQAESISRLATLCGKTAQILRPGDDQATEGPSDFEIIAIDGPALETAR